MLNVYKKCSAYVYTCLIILTLADGITYSFGVFLVELIEEFDADRSAASLIPSILVGITLGSGRLHQILCT